MGMMTAADILSERAKALPEDIAREVLDFMEFLSMKRRDVAMTDDPEDDWDKQIAADAASGRLDTIFAADIKAFEDGQCRKL
jgi:hypothetical protein